MKTLFTILVFATIFMMACSSPTKEELLIGTWKVDSFEMVNWDQFEAEMLTIAEKNINNALYQMYPLDSTGYYDNSYNEQMRSQQFEEQMTGFKTTLAEMKKQMLENLQQMNVTYYADKTSESKKGIEVMDKGTWSLNEGGTILTEKNQEGKETQSYIINLTDEIMEIESSIKLRDTMKPEETSNYDNNNFSEFIDFELKMKAKLSKITK